MTATLSTRPARLTRQESMQRTRAALMEAARAVFIRQGYQAATLDGIAAHAGFTKGAIYAHFKNKESIFIEVLEEDLRSQIEEINLIIEAAKKDPSVISSVFIPWVESYDEKESLPLLGIELQIEARKNPLLFDIMLKITERHKISLSAIFEEYFSIASKPPPMSFNDLAITIIAVTQGMALTRQTQEDLQKGATAKVLKMLLKME